MKVEIVANLKEEERWIKHVKEDVNWTKVESVSQFQPLSNLRMYGIIFGRGGKRDKDV